MLVLSRHKAEKVVIENGRIVVTVVDVRGDKVRLGFQADPSIAIHREEVQIEVDRERDDGGPGPRRTDRED